MKLKLLTGVLAIFFLACAAWFFSTRQDTTAPSGNAEARTVVQVKEAAVAWLGDDFSLPDKANERPVYDAYTLEQRRHKGLPITYAGTRPYWYGDHVAYLIFDDGPSDKNTEAILKILQDEHIHATFFLTGKNVERYPEVVKAIYASGNAIGIHSYSHVYDTIYASPAAYMKEVDQTANLIYQVIHARPIISRAPGGTAGHFTRSFWDALRAQGYIEVGWNALTGDADGTGKTAAKSVENLKKQLQQRPYLQSHLVILMHDGAGHEATVKALPQIIKLLKEKGYTFRVVTTAIPPCW